MKDLTTRSFEPHVTRLLISRMRVILSACLLETVAGILIIINYLGINLVNLINYNQLLIFFCVIAMTRCLVARLIPLITFAATLVLITIVNFTFFSNFGEANFNPSSIFSFYYSLLMPISVFIAVYSQNKIPGKTVLKELRWFAKWFMIVSSPTVIFYSALYFTGHISYLGFGLNFHYAAPYFLHRGSLFLLLASLVLISGKRAVLINFLAQLFLFNLKKILRFPGRTSFIFLLIVGLTLAFSEYLWSVIPRFMLMLEIVQSQDFTHNLSVLGDSHESLVLFGGRLEELYGIYDYFKQHPSQIWFGSPPGSNYFWKVSYSNYETYKSTAHFAWFGYLFRLGIIVTLIILAVFILRLFKGWDTKNPLWLVFVGILISSIFGGNLFYSPVDWVMIALYFRFGSEISMEIRKKNAF